MNRLLFTFKIRLYDGTIKFAYFRNIDDNAELAFTLYTAHTDCYTHVTVPTYIKMRNV